VEALLDANPQITNVRQIGNGALIHVPSHVGHHGSSPCGNRAILQDGESLDHLAWRCGVTLHALLRQNPSVRDFSLLQPGLVLIVPARSDPAQSAPVRWARTEADIISVKVERNVSQPGRANDGDGPAQGRAVPLPDRIPVDAPSHDAKVPGTNFNATGMVPCARNAGQPMAQCKFGVVREGNGNGTITIFWPDAGNRVIRFEDNTPMSYDESQADGGAKMTVGKKADVYEIRIGTQRFEIFEAVMTGG
jgi:hypothetical protein